MCARKLARRQAGRNFTLIIVAEGAQLPDGELVTREGAERRGQGRRKEDRQVRLGGVGDIIADELSNRLHSETRSLLLGHLQRGGGPTPFDRFLATQYGVHAIRLVSDGRLGRMVCYQPPAVGDVLIADAIGQLNKVDPIGAAVQTARGLGISFGDDFEAAQPPVIVPGLATSIHSTAIGTLSNF